ncbi:alpha-ketoglutarate-dependent dioxygenase AlkB family protein [Litoreibacter janthinus]|nr:alpha-ketoglutarate-dependent dioxygenase AlkB [Litoreibacter janthinus]
MSDKFTPKAPNLVLRGFKVFEGLIAADRQLLLLNDIRNVVSEAPLFTPQTSSGHKMSVRMTSAGQVGWVADVTGYRYQATHPRGMAWPAIPASVLEIWHSLVPGGRSPDCCLVNFYDATARMGLHQDRDEADFSWPVVSISLGDDALFRVGSSTRGGKTESIWLRSGDVVVMGGDARLSYHGVDRTKAGTSMLLAKGGRINLTLRVVT